MRKSEGTDGDEEEEDEDEESLKVAVVVGTVGFGHVHAAHRQTHAVENVAARRHALVYPVQTLRLLKTADLMLRGETTDR